MSRKPQVRQGEDGTVHIDLGWIIKSVISGGAVVALVAAYSSVTGVGPLTKRVSAQELRLESLEDSQRTMARNQRVVDEEVRIVKANTSWIQEALEVVLEKAGVTKRIPRPAVEPSRLEASE